MYSKQKQRNRINLPSWNAINKFGDIVKITKRNRKCKLHIFTRNVHKEVNQDKFLEPKINPPRRRFFFFLYFRKKYLRFYCNSYFYLFWNKKRRKKLERTETHPHIKRWSQKLHYRLDASWLVPLPFHPPPQPSAGPRATRGTVFTAINSFSAVCCLR